MRVTVGALVLLALPTNAFAEIVTTTDGRKIDLNADGAYQFIQTVATPSIPMTEQKPFFEPFAGEYGQNSIRFMPIFRNDTQKVIVGFRFKSVFKSAFGDEVFSFDGESSEKIAAGKSSSSETFYFFEDNQFISGEPYDKLSIFERSGTGTISTIITAVVFDDGTVTKSAP